VEQVFIDIINTVANAIGNKYSGFIEHASYILGAVALFLFGWILAELAFRFIIAMSAKLRLELLSDKLGVKRILSRMKTQKTPSVIIAQGVKGYLIFLFFIEATKIAQLTQIAEFLTKVINYVPEVIVAIFIMLIGMKIGNTTQMLISTSLNFAKTNTANVLGIIAKGTVITFAVLAALAELNIAEILIQTLFIGFVAMISVAGGLAFGLGGKDMVSELLSAIRKVEVKEHDEKKAVQ
jgi:hypothetical protein